MASMVTPMVIVPVVSVWIVSATIPMTSTHYDEIHMTRQAQGDRPVVPDLSDEPEAGHRSISGPPLTMTWSRGPGKKGPYSKWKDNGVTLIFSARAVTPDLAAQGADFPSPRGASRQNPHLL